VADWEISMSDLGDLCWEAGMVVSNRCENGR
jgi:hypothetical protein